MLGGDAPDLRRLIQDNVTGSVSSSCWSEIRKEPGDVRGETMRGLIVAVARERAATDHKVKLVRYGFLTLLLGLALIAGEAATLALKDAS